MKALLDTYFKFICVGITILFLLVADDVDTGAIVLQYGLVHISLSYCFVKYMSMKLEEVRA